MLQIAHVSHQTHPDKKTGSSKPKDASLWLPDGRRRPGIVVSGRCSGGSRRAWTPGAVARLEALLAIGSEQRDGYSGAGARTKGHG